MAKEGKMEALLSRLFQGIYVLRGKDGYSISPIFQTLPDRKIADYYKTIDRPLSLHMVRTNLKKQRYELPDEFVADLAQIIWNAKTYNVKGSPIYQYAVVLENYVKGPVLTALQRDYPGIVYPDLGPLPEDGMLSSREEDDEDDEEDEDADDADSSAATDEPRSVISRPAPSPMVSLLTSLSNSANVSVINSPRPNRKYAGGGQTELTYEAWCKRGRPPIIDRPHEQRIKNIMRMLKKIKNPSGQPLHAYFERLPDPKEYPGYFNLIQTPISLDMIRIKIRQRNYATVDQFVDDINLMFNNAKTYNSEGSQIYNDTLLLELKVQELIKEEARKPDSAYLSTDSGHNLKIPLDQVEVNGTIYKIGDWILVRNPNNLDRPIVAQLFRLWQTQDGKRWINVCWYYRPEQTVHRVDRLFYENEVCKSGQYRDHNADEIVGKCYVAYFTRYQRGDPGVQYEGPLFVCEYRYNDTDKGFNKIRTWKACLPDEVRHIEDPIIPLRSLRVMDKVESPLKHLLPPDTDYDDPIPDPTLGHPNAPPLIGAVYLRPPDPKDDLGQYSTSTNPNKNNQPKAINNVKNVTNVPLPQGNLPASALRQPPLPQAKSPYLAPKNFGVYQSFSPNQPIVHHANSSYLSVNTNYAYVIPSEVEDQFKNASEALSRLDASNNQRRSGVRSDKHPIIWMRTPPVLVPTKIQSSQLSSLSNIVQHTRKRTLLDSGSGEKRSKHDHYDQVVDAPGFGFAGPGLVNHSAKYLAWAIKLGKLNKT